MSTRLKRLGRDFWQARYIYLLLIPGILYFAIFHYGPMGGLVLAFKKYSARLGIFGSEWVGLANFRRIFVTPDAVAAIKNTLVINFSRMLFQFPVPIVLALLLNEMRGTRFKRIYQTIYTFPHFLSWVVVSTILINILSNGGAINAVIASLGGQRINFLADKSLFRPLLYITHNWKEMGWNSIIYIAAITSIDPTLYEAAIVDGANRGRQMWHVTLPGIRPTIVVLFILTVGRIMNSGFEQIFYMQNAAVRAISDILDTYVYRITFQATPNYGFSTAVGLFKSVINLIMIVLANRAVKWLGGNGLFS
ncbi:ABC transporter permease subunit [Eubacteriales bacterium OttesenSCG-928-A19]|nr:ABC transporter permease subunit [Eubacteriales bacterium OttesenSCG-928-A19]